MSRIKIKNFGPIREGYQEGMGMMDTQKVTVFIGNQGSGKSSVAKLISMFKWLEKALSINEIEIKDIKLYNRFIKNHCAYQNIHNYFHNDTEIQYVGDSYDFLFENGNIDIHKRPKQNKTEYLVPKIMYVPAERSFLSAIKFRNLEKIKELPQSLFAFFRELEQAQNELSDGIQLPIGNTKFEFDKLNETANIVGNGYKLKLSEASSGFQSFVPLYLVSHSIANSINKEKDVSKSELSSKQQKLLEEETKKILSNNELSSDVKMAALKVLSSRFKIQRFINIVEEPEQNLFPDSQHLLLYKLLEFANMEAGNELILTTHSPYIINYLSIAIQGEFLKNKLNTNSIQLEKLNSIVPIKSVISSSELVIYQLNEKTGIINKLPDYEGIPSDSNYLNQSLDIGNQLFDMLLEIEQSL